MKENIQEIISAILFLLFMSWGVIAVIIDLSK